MALVALMLAAGLTACTDGEENRQFATDQRKPGAPTATIVVTAPPPPPTQKETPVPARPLTDLVVSRGAPDTVYLRANRDLLALSAAGGSATDVFAPGENVAIVAYAASPAGDRAAVLTMTRDGASAVIVVDRTGKQLARWDDPDKVLANGGTGARPAPRSIDWSPQGDRLLAGFEPGGIVELPIAGSEDPGIALAADIAPWPVLARWSPTGQRIAFISAPADGPASVLMVLEPESAPESGLAGKGTPAAAAATPGATPVAGIQPLAGSAERPVVTFAWMPDGQSLLFTEGGAGQPANSDLWRIGVDGQGRKLIASAGSAAPVADMTLVAPSPDGRSVAYTVSIPDPAGERFNSLWVREIASGRSYQIPVDAETAVTDIRWTSEGLLYRTVPQALNARNYQGGAFDVFVIGADGQAKLLMTARVKNATPESAPGTPSKP